MSASENRPATPEKPMTPGRARAMIELRIANTLAVTPLAQDVHVVPIAALRALLDNAQENRND